MVGESLPLARTSLVATPSGGDTSQRPVKSEAELEFYNEKRRLNRIRLRRTDGNYSKLYAERSHGFP